MTDEQMVRDEGILHKAIEKAVRNGYDLKLVRVEGHTVVESRYDTEFEWHYTTLIFGHDFAKAFWGEGKTWVCSCGYSGEYKTDKDGWPDNPHPCDHGSYGHTVIAWQYHLQRMVLEEDPLQYLAKFLEDK